MCVLMYACSDDLEEEASKLLPYHTTLWNVYMISFLCILELCPTTILQRLKFSIPQGIII